MTLPPSTGSRTAPPHPPDVLRDLGPRPAAPPTAATEEEDHDDGNDDAPEPTDAEDHEGVHVATAAAAASGPCACEWCGARPCTECRAPAPAHALVRPCVGSMPPPRPRRPHRSSSSSSSGEPEVFPSLGLRLHHMEGVLETTRAYVGDVADWAQDVTAQHGAALGRLGAHVGALEREHGRRAARVRVLEDQLGELLADFTLQKRAHAELVVTVFLLSLLSSAAILTVALARACCGAPGASAPATAVPLASPLPLRAAHRRGRSTTPRPYSPSNF